MRASGFFCDRGTIKGYKIFFGRRRTRGPEHGTIAETNVSRVRSRVLALSPGKFWFNYPNSTLLLFGVSHKMPRAFASSLNGLTIDRAGARVATLYRAPA